MPTTPSPARMRSSLISLTASFVVAALFIRTAAARKAERASAPDPTTGE